MVNFIITITIIIIIIIKNIQCFKDDNTFP